jgi:hypothetical protein
MLSDFTGTYRLSKCARGVERIGRPHPRVFQTGCVVM